MSDRTPQKELEILRVSLARIAQACGADIEREIPGANGRLDLVFRELSDLAWQHDRGWNRLAAFIVGHIYGRHALMALLNDLRS
jgi:hypothetical protein